MRRPPFKLLAALGLAGAAVLVPWKPQRYALHRQQLERCRDIGNGLCPDRVVGDQQRRQLGDLSQAIADGHCIGVGEASCDACRTQRPGGVRCHARQGLGEFECL